MLTPDPFELSHIYAFALDYPNSVPTLKTGRLNSVKENFNASMGRLRSAMLFPATSGHLARYLERCITIAQTEIEGKATADLLLSPATYEQIIRRSKEIMAEADTLINTSQKTKEQWSAWIRDKIEIGAAPATLISTRDTTGTQAFLASFVTGGWTSFETMTGDLWEDALNAHPLLLSSLSGHKTDFYKVAKKKTDDKKDAQLQAPDQRMRLDLLGRYEFDLRNKMGTALRGEMRFDSLGGIREAFARAFSKDFDAIQSSIMDKSIDRLNALRNVIVHRGGIADDTYQNAMQKIGDLPTPHSPGTPIELTGRILAKILANAFDSSINLVRVVDDWIAAH